MKHKIFLFGVHLHFICMMFYLDIYSILFTELIITNGLNNKIFHHRVRKVDIDRWHAAVTAETVVNQANSKELVSLLEIK